MTLTEQIQYRAKAILAATGVALVGLAEWVVQDPATATAIQKVVPAPYTQLVPVLLGIIATVLVHQVSNVAPDPVQTAAAAGTVTPEPATDTQIVELSAPNGGETAGPAAH